MVLYKREFLLNIIFLFLANLLIKPYYIFFIEREFQNQAGTSNWGIYFTLFSLSMLPQIVLDLGMTSYVNRRVASHPSESNVIWSQTIWWRPVMAFVFTLIFLLLTFLGGYLNKYPEIILWIALNQILLSAILFFRAYISGLGFYRTDSLFSIADKLLFILLMFFSGMVLPMNQVSSFLIIQSISLSLPCLAGLVWVLIKIKPPLSLPEFLFPLKILKECLPYAGVFILMVLFSRMEPVWIDLLREDGARQSGLYAAAYRLLDAGNMMGFLFAGLLLPMFSNLLGRKDQPGLQSLFDLAWKLMTVSAILIAIPLAFYHRDIMQWLYEDSGEDVLYILILNLVPLTINYLLNTLLTAAALARSMNRLFLLSIIFNATGHLLFTHRYGALGAAWTALLTQLFTALLLAGFIFHQKLINIRWWHLNGFIFSSILAGIIGWGLQYVDLPPIYELLILIGTTLLVLLLTGWIPLRSGYRLIFRSHPA